jgi:hypothetical protein
MTEKAPRPFKSGVSDYEALYKRIQELGISTPIGQNGVDTEPKPAPPPESGHYPGYA